MALSRELVKKHGCWKEKSFEVGALPFLRLHIRKEEIKIGPFFLCACLKVSLALYCDRKNETSTEKHLTRKFDSKNCDPVLPKAESWHRYQSSLAMASST